MSKKQEQYNSYALKELKAMLLQTSQKEEPEEYKAIKDAIVMKEFQNMAKGR